MNDSDSSVNRESMEQFLQRIAAGDQSAESWRSMGAGAGIYMREAVAHMGDEGNIYIALQAYAAYVSALVHVGFRQQQGDA